MSIKSILAGFVFFLFSGLFVLQGQVPLDPEVRYGKLENGMTYYIRHNEEPKDRASFYIIQNVGAILEEDDQNGLAHFLEHMAFNGTKNFPEKGIINYLETHGIAFGREINAYTGRDETVYNITNVPTTHFPLLDSCLLILHDWSHYLLLEEKEIDAERGVIKEEWRTRRDANFRIRNQLMPVMYKDSKYAKRDVIGDLDVIENFAYESLRSFYHDWYRTDLQAIAVVGDFDVDHLEQRVKELFSKIPAVKNPKEREYYDVPDNKGPLVGIATDPEAQQTRISLFYKHNAIASENKDMGYLKLLMKESLYTEMINNRLNELVQKENPPFIAAYSVYTGYTRTKDAYTIIVLAENNKGETALEAVLKENERARRFGFTGTELERAKSNLLRTYEQAYKDRDKKTHDGYIDEYKEHFLQNEPAPGIEAEYLLSKTIIPAVKLEEINELPKKWIAEDNMVVTIQGPEKEEVTIPEKEKALAIIDKVKNMELEPYVDKVGNKPLVAEIPEGSNIIKEQTIDGLDAIEWILANGARVIIKITDFKEDEILFSAFSKGGSSLVETENLPSANLLNALISMYGVGDFDNVSLQKMLAGKIVRLSPYLGTETEGFSGNASPQDMETLLQLVYLYFQYPRFDQTAHDAFLARIIAYIENMSKDPNSVFRDTVTMVTANYHPRVHPVNKEYLEKIDFETVRDIYLQRFQDASDFTFIFTGNIDIEKVKPLIEKYIGGIRDIDREETWKNHHINSPEGVTTKMFKKEMKTPKSSVFVNFNGDYQYTPVNNIYLDVIEYILDMKYVETIREEEGGSYGVNVFASASQFPEEEYSLNMQFDCDPEKADHLKEIIYKEIGNIMEAGPTQEDLDKARKKLIKGREENLRENQFWSSAIQTYFYHNLNVVDKKNFDDVINDLTIEKIKEAANKFFGPANKVEVIMKPKV